MFTLCFDKSETKFLGINLTNCGNINKRECLYKAQNISITDGSNVSAHA